MNQKSDFEILEYIERPENVKLASFFRSVQEYYGYYGLNSVLPLLELLGQFKKWNEYLDKWSIGVQTYKIVLNDMVTKNYNEFEKFIVLDILILHFHRIGFAHLRVEDQGLIKESFQSEQNRLSQKLLTLSEIEVADILKSLEKKAPQIQYDSLYIYLLQFKRGVEIRLIKNNYFEQQIKSRIGKLTAKYGKALIKCRAELVLEKINNPLTVDTEYPNTGFLPVESGNSKKDITSIKKANDFTYYYADNEKLSIKDVANVLKCHESQVRRLIVRKHNPIPTYRYTPKGKMYFFYPEIIDWLKSNKQQSSLEEAGKIFRRKPKGTGKTRRPRLK